MRRAGFVWLMAVALLCSPGAWAAGIDGEKPLVCDFVEAAQCDGVAECIDVTLEQIGLPRVFHVDFELAQVGSEDGQQTNLIRTIQKLDTALLLQGHANGRGWTLVIHRDTGHLSGTLNDVEGAFVLAGACTAR
jgi:hypothetical protein